MKRTALVLAAAGLGLSLLVVPVTAQTTNNPIPGVDIIVKKNPGGVAVVVGFVSGLVVVIIVVGLVAVRSDVAFIGAGPTRGPRSLPVRVLRSAALLRRHGAPFTPRSLWLPSDVLPRVRAAQR